MARLANKVSQSPAPRLTENLYDATPPPPSGLRALNGTLGNPSLSPTPEAFNSSDKENRSQVTGLDKGKGRALMPSPQVSNPLSDGDRGSKRKRTEDRDRARSHMQQRRRITEPEESDLENGEDSDTYDPDQSIETRRALRRSLRNIAKDLNDHRAEFLNPASTGLPDTIARADEINESIKQTVDATIDSRILVAAADLSYKKTSQLTLGTSAQGIDVDEFLSKCLTFMRRELDAREGPRHQSSTQRRRRPIATQTQDSDDEGADGDVPSWQFIGELVCVQHNSRPAVPGFLLGPLSLQKRARKPVQRAAPLRHNNIQETRPEILQASDIEKSENANLTVLCTRILSTLMKVQRESQEAVEAEATDDMTEEETKALMIKYGIHDTGGVDLFRFVINPHSFGQTVENLFYVSFLIRDGKAGISIDSDGLPSVEPTEPRKRSEAIAKGVSKHQAILSIDMPMWKELIEVFNIKDPLIPHRIEEDHQTQVGPRGWYS